MTEKRMYLTAGIGSTGELEAFTKDYDLPNDMVYAETCASIGLIFLQNRCWSWRQMESTQMSWKEHFTTEQSVECRLMENGFSM